MRSRVLWLSLGGLALAWLAACEGGGSDIGPRLDPLPNASCKVLVLDDQGRGVAAAAVRIGGGTLATGRSGRGDLLANPTGRQFVQVLADAASATDADRLASLWFAANLPGGELPFTVHLPDVAASAVLTVPTSTALPAQQLDDTAQSGGLLVLPAGTQVQAPPLVTSVDLRLAALQAQHLPGELPAAAVGAWLFGRGFYVDPASATFVPGATLEVPDDLGLPAAGTATLFWLDSSGGDWTAVGSTATSTGGRLRLDGGVGGAGLYVYAAAVSNVATVRGRVVDAKGNPVSGALVRVDGGKARTAGDGRFQFTAVPATLADGTPRAVQVELRGGADWLPVGTQTATPVLATGGVTDLGDLVLDTVPAVNVRILMVDRGAAAPLRRLTASTQPGLTAAVVFGDQRGQVTIEEMAADRFGFVDAFALNNFELSLLEGLIYLHYGTRWTSFNAFYGERFWEADGRNTNAFVIDSIGGGAVYDALVTQGTTPDQGFVGRTTEGGVVVVDRNFADRATASTTTTLGGQTVISAFSVQEPYSERLELPLRRALRPPTGSFDRHGRVTGDLIGYDLLAEQRLRTTRLLEGGDWLGETMTGVPIVGSVPVKIDPTLPPGAFAVGVATPLGNLAAAEGTTNAGVFTLAKVGIASRLAVPEAAVSVRALALAHLATTAFVAPQALSGLDPAFTPADLAFALALEEPDGLVVDVARGIGGNLTASGTDAALLLPPLQGQLAGDAWLAVLGVDGAAAGGQIAQRTLLRFAGAAAPVTPFLPVPAISAPANGGTVPATGFTVQFTLPAGCQFATIELHSPSSAGSDELAWDVVLPPTATSYEFVKLPTNTPYPLVAGRTYTLKLTAFRADDYVVTGRVNPYQAMAGYWFSVDLAERGVTALSSLAITVTLN